MISKNWVTTEVVRKAPGLLKFCLLATPNRGSLHALALGLNAFFQNELKQNAFEFMAGRTLLVNIDDINYQFQVRVRNNRLVVDRPDGSHNVAFRGHFADLFLLSMQRVDPDTLFFRRRLLVTGDTEFGLQLKNLLDTIELQTRLPSLLQKASTEFADAAEQLQVNLTPPAFPAGQK